MPTHLVECWAGCGEEFPINTAADRGSPELINGIAVACPNCSEKYTFTVDGDGEPSLDSRDTSQLGDNITGHDADASTNF